MTIILKKKILISFWILYFIALVGGIFLFTAIACGWIGYMPTVDQLENPIDKYASQIISSDGKTYGRFALQGDNRLHVSYQDLSPDLVNALIATEDARFTEHSGIDVYALSRAFIKTGLLRDKSAGGGSTISQQLAKQLFSPRADRKLERIFQKPIEWVIAVKLERLYTKEEIINLYLNKFDFVYDAVGIQSASRLYFNTTPKNLTTEQAAMLVGMAKNPNYYNPLRNKERAKGRRNTVFGQMEKYGYLTSEQADSLSRLPLQTQYTRIEKDITAPYFREYLRTMLTAAKPDRSKYPDWRQGQFVEDSIAWETNPLYGWCAKNKNSEGKNYNIYTDGLKIYTTLDSRMQKYAEEAVREHIGGKVQPAFDKEKKGQSTAPFSRSFSTEEVRKFMLSAMQQTDRYKELKARGLKEEEILAAFQEPEEMRLFSWNGPVDTIMSPWDSIRYNKSLLRTGFMAMDPHNGHVKAYIGGIDHGTFKYDGVTMGRRQVGSTMKPFVYSLAMLEGISPCDGMIHQPQYLRSESGEPWSPKNASDAKLGEWVSIQWGLQNSSNWVTAYLMSKLSPHSLVRLVRSFGLRGELDPVLPMALGTPSVSVSEMVSGYTVFANRGIQTEPVYVTRIEDTYGNTIASFTPRMNDVLPEEASFKMLSMLQSVIDGGTGGRIRYTYGITAPMGGKTGTTQNNADGWFIGFTPSLVAGCWVGGEDPSVRFDSTREGQGASTALPVYALFMKKIYADKTLSYSHQEQFDIPEEYADPCNGHPLRNHGEEPVQSGGIDKMFE
ncbi:MAG: transglycosylase domain-containing protein [Tannerellaceae bacterium]|nr:transglycosylase domain-containing protein [Tannerellaceae bacterium]